MYLSLLIRNMIPTCSLENIKKCTTNDKGRIVDSVTSADFQKIYIT